LKVIETYINDLLIIDPVVFEDNRGYFFESFNLQKFSENDLNINFIQDNEAKSSFGVLRGLHFQKYPYEQTKLIRAIQGEILDVVVDIRENSKTFGKHFSIVLNDVNKKQLLVPKGFAHAYIVLSETAIISYKVDQKYMPQFEGGILWSDNTLNIDWKLEKKNIITSEKDQKLPLFNQLIEKS
jgi:dTDP-4-dehydrorhamnose 3,5-epimerase